MIQPGLLGQHQGLEVAVQCAGHVSKLIDGIGLQGYVEGTVQVVRAALEGSQLGAPACIPLHACLQLAAHPKGLHHCGKQLFFSFVFFSVLSFLAHLITLQDRL